MRYKGEIERFRSYEWVVVVGIEPVGVGIEVDVDWPCAGTWFKPKYKVVDEWSFEIVVKRGDNKDPIDFVISFA